MHVGMQPRYPVGKSAFHFSTGKIFLTGRERLQFSNPGHSGTFRSIERIWSNQRKSGIVLENLERISGLGSRNHIGTISCC